MAAAAAACIERLKLFNQPSIYIERIVGLDFEQVEMAQKMDLKPGQNCFFERLKRQNLEVVNHFQVLRHAQGFAVIRDEES